MIFFLKIHLDRFDGICMVVEIQAVVTSSLEGLNVTELNDTFSVLWFLKCQIKFHTTNSTLTPFPRSIDLVAQNNCTNLVVSTFI